MFFVLLLLRNDVEIYYCRLDSMETNVEMEIGEVFETSELIFCATIFHSYFSGFFFTLPF